MLGSKVQLKAAPSMHALHFFHSIWISYLDHPHHCPPEEDKYSIKVACANFIHLPLPLLTSLGEGMILQPWWSWRNKMSGFCKYKGAEYIRKNGSDTLQSKTHEVRMFETSPWRLDLTRGMLTQHFQTTTPLDHGLLETVRVYRS